MKQHFLIVALGILLLAGCAKDSSYKQVRNGEPITAIRITGDSTLIYETDYLPALDCETLDASQFSITGDYALMPGEQGTLWIVGRSKKVEVLTLNADGENIDIPVLPQGSSLAHMSTLGCEGNAIQIGTTEKQEGEIYFRVFVQNQCIECETNDNEEGYQISLAKAPKLSGRSYLRIFAASEQALYNDILVPLQDGKPVLDAKELTRHDANAQVLYSLLVDRFYDGNTSNDAPLNLPDVDPRVDYQGGDLKGITCKIEDGFFDSLGINTIWISPITQNPQDAWGQYHNPDTRFSGYHGYWPIFNTKIDDRMGTDAELRELLATAHKHNINVILDYVANHMHIMSPTLQEHPDWITDSILPDGRRNFELWDEARLTTWFDKHIPTLDLERHEVCDAMTDTALYWVGNYDFDGYRHDACKHIPLDYWRMFTHKMKSRYPGRALWMIGETYGDAELIGSYVKTGMLNAQFDFNIYHTAIDVLGKEGESMKRMQDVIEESLAGYGFHHTMGNISGNHDKCRFISLAGGAVDWDEDPKAAGWNRQIGVTANGNEQQEKDAFKKALLLEVINLTIPGVPCIYQGDEYGQAGANDPDNRRMMRFGGYNENENNFRENIQNLIATRRSSMPLLYGDFECVFCDDNVLIFNRTYMGQTITVAINKGVEERSFNAEELNNKIGAEQITVAPLSYVIL